MIKFSVPGKIHLLGEHAVVYGKPALLAAIDLRVTVSITPSLQDIVSELDLKNIIEPIIRKHLKLKTIPPYQLKIDSQIPIGSGLGSSAAVSAAYLGALTTFLGYPWDLKLINELTFEAEKVFHGNPSGADNSTVVYGGLIWYRKETPDLKIITPLPFSIPAKLSKNFVIINTGTPKESTKDIVDHVKQLYDQKPKIVQKFLDDQERLVKELVVALKEGDQNQLVSIIRQGERNLESLGVVGKRAQEIIRLVEKIGGAAKISGAGGVKEGSGMILAYHKDPKTLLNLTKTHHLPTLSIKLGGVGLLRESSATGVDFRRK